MSEYEKKVLNLLEQIATQTKPQPKESSEETEEHEHWNAESLADSECPECKKELEKLNKIAEKSFREQFAKHECVGCGKPVFPEREETCPECGKTEAREREA